MTQANRNKIQRSLIRLVRGYSPDDGQLFANQASALRKATNIVQYFYIALFFFTINVFMFSWEGWSQVSQLPQPIWSTAWLNHVPYLTALNLFGISAIFSTLLAVIYPTNRLFRIMSFVAFFLLVSITNSFGKINHGFHVWVTGGFFLIFLPDLEKKSITNRHRYLTAIFGTQLLTLSFYTSSGLWKLWGGFIQFSAGQIHTFHPLAMSQQIANRLLQTNSESLLGAFFIEHPFVGWPLYSSAVLLELFSVLVAFRPRLHRFWGISLLLFHLGTWLTMSILFHTNMLFVALFFILSPVHPENLTVKDVLFSLPIVGDLLTYFSNRRASGAKPKLARR